MPVLLVHRRAPEAVRLLDRLRRAGFPAEEARGPAEARERLEAGRFELVLLDTALPDEEARDVLADLKRLGGGVTMIWCAVEAAAREREVPDADEEGLAAFPALVERIRRVVGPGADRTEVGDLVVDHRRGSFQRAGRVLDLTPTEAALLRYLLEHRGRTVTRGELLKAIWDIGFDTGTNLVDVHISRLRAKLDEPFDGPLVLTVRGVGYTLGAGSGTEDEAGGA